MTLKLHLNNTMGKLLGEGGGGGGMKSNPYNLTSSCQHHPQSTHKVLSCVNVHSVLLNAVPSENSLSVMCNRYLHFHLSSHCLPPYLSPPSHHDDDCQPWPSSTFVHVTIKGAHCH